MASARTYKEEFQEKAFLVSVSGVWCCLWNTNIFYYATKNSLPFLLIKYSFSRLKKFHYTLCKDWRFFFPFLLCYRDSSWCTVCLGQTWTNQLDTSLFLYFWKTSNFWHSTGDFITSPGNKIRTIQESLDFGAQWWRSRNDIHWKIWLFSLSWCDLLWCNSCAHDNGSSERSEDFHLCCAVGVVMWNRRLRARVWKSWASFSVSGTMMLACSGSLHTQLEYDYSVRITTYYKTDSQ